MGLLAARPLPLTLNQQWACTTNAGRANASAAKLISEAEGHKVGPKIKY